MQKNLVYLLISVLSMLCLQNLFSQTGKELGEKADQEFLKGNMSEALNLATMAAGKIKIDSGENSVAYAEAFSNIAIIYITMNQDKAAEPFATKAIEIVAKLKGRKSVEYAYYIQNAGNIAIIREEYGQAEKIFQESISLMDKYTSQHDSNYLYALNSLGAIYYHTEQYNKSTQVLTMLLDTYKKYYPENILEPTTLLVNLGEMYRSIGSYAKSRECFQKAIRVFESGRIAKSHPLYAVLLNNLGGSYMNMLDYRRAETYLNEAMRNTLAYYDKSNPNYTTALNNLGQVQFLQKKYMQAITSYQEVLKIYKTNKNDSSIRYAVTLNNLAQVYILKNNPVTADSFLMAAKQVYEKLVDTSNLMLAAITQNQGLAYQLSGHTLQAFRNFVKSQNIYIDYITRNFYGLSAQEKLNLTTSMQQRFQALPYLLQKKDVVNPAEVAGEVYHAQLALKNMVLRDQQSLLRTIRATHDSATIMQFTNWKKGKSMLARQKGQQALPAEVPANLEEVTNQLEQSLAQQSSSFAEQQQYFHLSTKDISGKLQPGEAAVEFLRFSSYNPLQATGFFYAALVVRPGDSLPAYITLCKENELTALLQPVTCSSQEAGKLIMSLYQSVQSSGKPSKGAVLYDKIWKPLLPYLKQTSTVYIAPAGLLYQVAFHAIPAGSKQMLGDLYTFRYLLSTGDIAVKQLNREPDIRNVSFWGNMTYNQAKTNAGKAAAGITLAATGNPYFENNTKSNNDCKIPYTWPALQLGKKQVEDLQALCLHKNIGFSAYQRSEATEDMLKEAHFSAPSVLHISTHGFFIRDASGQPVQNPLNVQMGFLSTPDPLLRSGIVFSGANGAWKGQPVSAGREDGIVTAYEIAQIDLGNTPLVILDACESALGSIYGSEGVFGLQRAFRIAGADKIIMSLWKVPEKETNELVKNFYDQWLGGKPVYKALRDAQQEMRKKNLPPYYWAGFIVAE